MARMFGNSNYIDLRDPINSISVSSVVHPECSFEVCLVSLVFVGFL